jgi:hypothetical protein
LHFLLDEYLSPELAVIARGLGLDVRSVHEIGRTGYDDEGRLSFVASKGCIFVTRNRDDFIALTKIFYATNQAHHGVLLVPHSLPNHRSQAIAHALVRWQERYRETDPGLGFVDFLLCHLTLTKRSSSFGMLEACMSLANILVKPYSNVRRVLCLQPASRPLTHPSLSTRQDRWGLLCLS